MDLAVQLHNILLFPPLRFFLLPQFYSILYTDDTEG